MVSTLCVMSTSEVLADRPLEKRPNCKGFSNVFLSRLSLCICMSVSEVGTWHQQDSTPVSWCVEHLDSLSSFVRKFCPD